MYGAADLQFDDHFAEVFAVKKADKGAGRIFETLDHGFPPFDFFRADPRAHIGEKCFAARLVLAADKARAGAALYWPIMPHRAMRPWWFIWVMAASRWAPPTLSK